MKNKSKASQWISIMILVGFLAACQPGSPSANLTPIADFIPPTSNPAAEESREEEYNPLPTRQPNCENQLRFLDDLTIPDGTEFSPGEELTKRWLVRNVGSCNWNRTYSLELISGLSLGAGTKKELFPARQSSDAVIEILFTAPDNPGRYNSWWQAYDPDGNRFGDPIYTEIVVLSD
jgi:hypothetical protein